MLVPFGPDKRDPDFIMYIEEPELVHYGCRIRFHFCKKTSTEEANLSKLEKHQHKIVQGASCTEEVTLPKSDKRVHKTVQETTGTEGVTLPNLEKLIIFGHDDTATKKENSTKMEKPRPPYPAHTLIARALFKYKQVVFQEAQLIQYAAKLGISSKLYANFQTIALAIEHGVSLRLIESILHSRIL